MKRFGDGFDGEIFVEVFDLFFVDRLEAPLGVLDEVYDGGLREVGSEVLDCYFDEFDDLFVDLDGEFIFELEVVVIFGGEDAEKDFVELGAVEMLDEVGENIDFDIEVSVVILNLLDALLAECDGVGYVLVVSVLVVGVIFLGHLLVEGFISDFIIVVVLVLIAEIDLEFSDVDELELGFIEGEDLLDLLGEVFVVHRVGVFLDRENLCEPFKGIEYIFPGHGEGGLVIAEEEVPVILDFVELWEKGRGNEVFFFFFLGGGF